MIKRFFFFLIFTFLIFNSWSAPKKLEIIFLSPNKGTSYLKNLDSPFLFGAETANNDFECIPMGEGCFHPQLGIVPKPVNKYAKKKNLKKEIGVKTINAVETDLINCDKGNYFDIYCGEAKSEKLEKSPTYEIWIDISGSMKNVDYGKGEYCERRHSYSKLKNECGDKILFSTFNTSIAELGDERNLCLSYGLNNKNKMVDWIEGSNANHLIIITDVEEYQEEFREYLDQVNAPLVGIGTKLITADKIYDLVIDRFKKECRR